MKPLTTAYQWAETIYYKWSSPRAVRKQRRDNKSAKRNARHSENQQVAKAIEEMLNERLL